MNAATDNMGSGTLAWLRARATIAGDLWREGRINRGECFRLEVDAALGRDSGPVQYERNTEYTDLLADGWSPKRSNGYKLSDASCGRVAWQKKSASPA